MLEIYCCWKQSCDITGRALYTIVISPELQNVSIIFKVYLVMSFIDAPGFPVGTLVQWNPESRRVSNEFTIYSSEEVYIGRDKKRWYALSSSNTVDANANLQPIYHRRSIYFQ